MKPEFKLCNCPLESWEVIVVDRDEQFEDRSTIYYHCEGCGEDYAILDFYTDEILYCNSKLKRTKEFLQRETSISSTQKIRLGVGVKSSNNN